MDYPEYGDLLEKATDELYPADDYRASVGDTPVASFLATAIEDERERLHTALGMIDEQLETRREIHDAELADREEALRRETELLEQISRPFRSQEQMIEQQRRIQDHRQALRDAQRAQWLDCRDLRTDQRTLLRELAELNTDITEFGRFESRKR